MRIIIGQECILSILKGYIVYDKIGEGEYNQTEKVIQSLLAERNGNKETKNIDAGNTTLPYENKSQFNSTNNIRNFLKQPVDFSKIKTPELYFGNQGSNSAVGNSRRNSSWTNCNICNTINIEWINQT